MHFRLRNPPPGFITRPKESAELVAALERAPLAIVWGLGGFGKSALARAVLHEHFSKAVPRAVAIDVRPQESNTEILGEIARAIGERVSPKRARWAETARDPQALLMTALDLADAHDLWLVIDDAHNIDAPTLALLLGTLAGFARSSRWLFVSRVRPDFAELAGQLVQVPAMSREALRALCEQTAPLWSKEDCQRAAQAAAGSPWRLLQLAAQRQYTFNETLVRSAQNDVLLGLDARQQSLLFDLCLLDRPVPISALSEVSPMVDTLDRRGLIELEAGAQARLHDVARELLLPLLTDQEMTGRAARLAEKLAGRPESVCAVEAVALFLRAVQPEKAAATASERSQGIVKDAQAARLWQVLQAEDDASFATAKQACALALEGGPALQWFVAQPAPADLDQRFAWLSALYMALQLARVIAEGDAFEESARAAGRNDLLAESLLLHAEVLCNLSQPESAAALLEDFRDGDETQMARRDALLARALLLLGQSREATRLAERLVNQFATLRAAARRRVFADLVGLLGDLGRMRWVARITEETDDLTDYVYQHRVHHLIEAGHLDEGVNAYARLLPFSRWPPLYAIPLRLLYSQLCLMRGDFLGLDAHVLETTEEAERCGHAEFIGWTWVPQYLLAIHRGRTLPERALTTNGPEAYYVRALQQIGAMRAHGRVPPEGWLEDDAVPEIVDVRISWYRAFALRAVLQKDFGEAKRRADAMLALAQDNDVAMHACDALVLAARGIALVAGDRAVAAEHAQKLAARAKKMNSLLYASEAEFFAAVTKVPCLDPAPLERLLTQEDTDPCAARRSRALLGGGGGDAYDQLLTEAILGLANIEITGDAGAKWGLDYVRKRVWFADRAPLPLDRHKLSWSLLTAIAEAGEISGEISKEELTVRVWSRPDYHPLRDDKRLQVALSRLRETLGDHSRIETTVAGYRIAGSLRRLKPRR